MADDDVADDIGVNNGFVQGDDNVLKAAIQAREAECNPKLLRENPVQALKIALQDPPYNTRTIAVKEQSAMVAVKALLAIKEADADKALGALSAEELDVLMKYVYRGLAMTKRDQDHYKGLLKWHPKVLATAGPASIVRVMAEVARPL
mmetsp:Transcript_17744/g.36106  ORF Transcript_17744/g.36106 Transcript_17744/m.36106 type:complete len:148 (+) Transcript_17744:66-509(+)